MSSDDDVRAEMEARRLEVWSHNREMMDRCEVPAAARRGVNAAAGFGQDFIRSIDRRERAAGGVYLIVSVGWRKDTDRADHCYIVGPRGKCSKAF